jgi:protocatechuate 3,4-dioxygenase beta subunit
VAARQGISPTGPRLVSGVVRDLTGHALGGVCVLAAAADGTLRMARTSASGRYVMVLPHPGAYSVRYRYCRPGKAALPAFASRAAGRIYVGVSPVTVLPAATVRPASQAGEGAALAAVGLALPEGRITILPAGGGHVAGEIGVSGVSGPADAGPLSGRVTNPAGKPLSGICAWVVGSGFAEGIPTSRSGTYTFGADAFPPGRYQVLFTSGCASTIYPFAPIAPGPWAPEWYNGKFARSKANKVQLLANKATRGINAIMRPAAKIGGVVTGSDGRLIKNACVLAVASPTLALGRAVTNSRGAYTLTGLDPGRYRILVLPACPAASVYGPAWYPRAQSYSAARAVPARFGHLTGGINVVVPKLGTISGVIRLGGKTGKPLGGICVGATSTTDFSQGGLATSRSDGSYTLVGLPAGNYQVEANAGCGNNGNYAPVSFPHPVRVVNGKVVPGVNLYLQPGGTISGTVTDAATAKPLAGICITDGNFDFGITNAAGSYTIKQLPAERTTVQFLGGCGNTGSYAPQYYNDQVAHEAAQQVTVTAGHVTGGINAAMLAGATIAGRVTNTVGRPVSGVCIAVLPANLAGLGAPVLGGNALTTSSGSYADANLAPGDYAVAFFGGCLQPSNPAVLQWFKGEQTAGSAGLVDAPASRPVTGIDAVVSPAGAIAGTVVSATGQPVGFGCVTAINSRTGQPSGFQSLGGDAFIISSLASGTYTVVAAACDGKNLAQSVYPHPVTVRAGLTTGKVSLKLPPGGTVTGRVTAVSTGRPVPGACVQATPVNAAAASLGIGGFALTSRSGSYKVVGLRGGSYTVQVFPNCAGPAVNLRSVTLRHPVLVTQGKVTAGVNASLQAGGSIAGQVSGPGAVAVPGACVEADQVPGGLVGAALTDAHGRYVLTGLTPGKYKVEFGDPSCSDGAAGLGIQWYQGASDSGSATVITVTAGQTASAVNATLPADGTIGGSVTGASAAMLTGVCVSAVPLAAGEPAVFTVSSGGSYLLGDLKPGRYRVEFQAGCGQAGVTTQWWQGAASSAAATIITVGAGAAVSGINAVMSGG